MQDKYRLYRRSNRSNGTFYAENCDTGARESLGTKNHAEAEKLLQAKFDCPRGSAQYLARSATLAEPAAANILSE